MSSGWLGLQLIIVFDNAVVCELIEGKRPAGIFATLNDATATAHADPSAADNSFIQRSNMLSANPNFESRGNKFMIKHYAGDVLYNVPGMTDKNKDTLIRDILDLIEGSKDKFLHTLFPDKVDRDSKKRPPTAGDKIKQSANDLVANLMRQVIPDECSWSSLTIDVNPITSEPSSQTRTDLHLSTTTRLSFIKSNTLVFKKILEFDGQVSHTERNSQR